MLRKSAWRRGVTFALSLWATSTLAKTPCDDVKLAPNVAKLHQRLLARGHQAVAWATIAQDATKAAESGSPADRACAHYIAGGAHFFLSTNKTDQLRHAADTVRHLLAAQALAPTKMTAIQPKNRLRTAWARFGEVPGWLKAGKPIEVQFPAVSAGEHLTLAPPDQAFWLVRCGDTPTCRAATLFTLPPISGALSLRPGTYRVERIGPCGSSAANIDITGPIELPKPALCSAQIKVLDGDRPIKDAVIVHGNKTLDATDLHQGMTQVTISAPGYEPQTIDLAQAETIVTLSRCPATLTVEIDPPDATLEGDGIGPWGERIVTATHPGYIDLQTTIQLLRPATCVGTQHHSQLVMVRIAKPEVASNPVPWMVMGLGGLSTLGGLVASGAASETQDQIDNYTIRRTEDVGIDSLIDQRGRQARTADILVGFGLTTAVVGLVLWYLWED